MFKMLLSIIKFNTRLNAVSAVDLSKYTNNDEKAKVKSESIYGKMKEECKLI